MLGAAESLSRAPAPRPARGAGEHDLPGHDPGGARAGAGALGPARRPRLPPGLLARAGRPRPHGLDHARPRRRWSAASRPSAPGARWTLYALACDDAGPGREPRGGRADQAAREHLPQRQHRPGQRAGRCSATAWASTSGRSSTRPPPSRSASCPSGPGPGLGGHCIPIDPFYLTWKAREFDLHTEFIELAGKVNSQMPALLRRQGRAGRSTAAARRSTAAACW